MTNVLVPPGIVVAIAALAFLTMLTQNTATNTVAIQTQLDATNHLIPQKEKQRQVQAKQSAELEKKIAALQSTYNAFTTALESFETNHAEINGDLGVVASSLPGTVNLDSINYADKGVTLDGTASTEKEVLAYAAILRGSSRFSEVIISSVRTTQDGMSFSFTLTR